MTNYIMGAFSPFFLGVIDSDINPSILTNFFTKVCDNYLEAFQLPAKSTSGTMVDLFRKAKKTEYFKDCNFYLDSGGFQILSGTLPEKRVKRLFDTYYEYLKDNDDGYNKAFTLDIPLASGTSKYFPDMKSIEDNTLKSYTKALTINPEKIICIHQAALWDFYKRMFDENDFIHKFKYFSVGGVGALSGKSLIYRPYIPTLLLLLNRCRSSGIKSLNFHVLGIASTIDNLAFELIKLHIKKVHNINLSITFDTAIAGRRINLARQVPTFKDDIISEEVFSSSKIHLRTRNNKEVDLENLIKNEMKKLIKYDIEVPVFDPKTDNKIWSLYGTLYYLMVRDEIEKELRTRSLEIYPLFDVDRELFIKKIESLRISTMNNSIACSIEKSLDILTSLDEDYCEYTMKTFFRTTVLNSDTLKF